MKFFKSLGNFLIVGRSFYGKLVFLILLIALGILLYKSNVAQGTNSNRIIIDSNGYTPLVNVKEGAIVKENVPKANLKDQTNGMKMPDNARIIFLHHSTGENIWNGGVPQLMEEYNKNNGKSYKIIEQTYPSTKGGYPWSNYPYDYYNLWVKHMDNSQDRKELNLDQIAANNDIIIFKHCFPVGEIQEDIRKPDVNSDRKSLENYKLQYNALKNRMLQFPNKKFIVWTGAALAEDCTNPEMAKRSKEWATWVKSQWDKSGDNIFIWDFEKLETDGGLYLKYQAEKSDSHPNSTFSKIAAADFVKRLVEVIGN